MRWGTESRLAPPPRARTSGRAPRSWFPCLRRRWTNDAFATHVATLEATTSRVLGQNADAERDAFRQVARHERAFWEMASESADG